MISLQARKDEKKRQGSGRAKQLAVSPEAKPAEQPIPIKWRRLPRLFQLSKNPSVQTQTLNGEAKADYGNGSQRAEHKTTDRLANDSHHVHGFRREYFLRLARDLFHFKVHATIHHISNPRTAAFVPNLTVGIQCPPSPLNGERAGVRGVTLAGAQNSVVAHDLILNSMTVHPGSLPIRWNPIGRGNALVCPMNAHRG